ncbi:MAG: hypothetical protein JSS97_07030 [Actinobacteria bacterium]|nr:hypothetical protein [Actinomycetota bacterium]
MPAGAQVVALGTLGNVPGSQYRRAALAAVLVALATIAVCVGAAGAAGAAGGSAELKGGVLVPPGKQVYFGVSDTGNPANFGEFSSAVSKHPAVIESFRAWGSELRNSIQRWEIARARPMIHITTADPQSGAETISLAAIARGAGDGFLIRVNHLFAEKHMRAYVRPLGEPNRCLNVYAAYECAGHPREAEDSARNYRRAFRRIYVIVHGGGKTPVINRRLAEAGLPPLNANVGGLPKAPVAIVWSPLPSGSPPTKKNQPQSFFPGKKWVDWTGTDFYASYPEWGALTRLYNRYPEKPFAITEWGVEAGDDPAFVSRLFAWVKAHPRTKMLVYYQDFGSTSSYRIQNYAESLAVLTTELHAGNFPAYAPGAPHLPPPPPGGVEAGG